MNMGGDMHRVLIAIVLILLSSNSISGIKLNATRVVYNEEKNDSIVTIISTDDDVNPYLIRAYIESINGGEQDVFVVTPPLFRLEPRKSHNIKLLNINGNTLPNDRESVFWLNVKAIPPLQDTKQNNINLTFKNKIKVFYRPLSLSRESDVESRFGSVSFEIVNNSLIVSNLSRYYLSFYDLNIGDYKVDTFMKMVPPLGTQEYELKQKINHNKTVSWQWINDFGSPSTVSTSYIK